MRTRYFCDALCQHPLVNMSAGYHLVAASLPAVCTICTMFCCSPAKGLGGHTKHEHATSLWKSTEVWNLSLLFDHNKVSQTFNLGLTWCLGSFPCNLVRTAAAGRAMVWLSRRFSEPWQPVCVGSVGSVRGWAAVCSQAGAACSLAWKQKHLTGARVQAQSEPGNQPSSNPRSQ